MDRCYQFFYILSDYNPLFTLHIYIYIYIYIGGPTDNLRNTYGSSIAEHPINNDNCAVRFSVDFFSVLSKSHASFHLKVLEIIHILHAQLAGAVEYTDCTSAEGRRPPPNECPG